MRENQNARMNCNGIAPYYQSLEYLCFGKGLERCRFAFLEESKASRRAMVCGGGDGRFLARLLSMNREVQVDYVDLSPKMLEIAERRVASMGGAFRGRVTFHVGDVRQFESRRSGYDLIVTNFFLDCFSDAEIDLVVACVANLVAPGARWIVAEFHEAKGPISKIWTRGVTRALYAAFGLTTGLRVTKLPNYAAALSKARFRRLCEEYALGGLLHSSLWEQCTSILPSRCGFGR